MISKSLLKFQRGLGFNRKFTVFCLGILVALGSVAFLYEKLSILEQDNKKQSSQIDNSQEIIELLNARLTDLNTELGRQNKKITDLKKSNKQLKKDSAVLQEELEMVANPTNPLASPTVSQVQNSVYDRIVTDNTLARQMIIDALKMIEKNTPAYFSKLQNHAAKIVPTALLSCQSGFQTGHTIYIGYESRNCLVFVERSIVASILIHEVMHIVNVYVNGVVSSGTAEQELPSYYAQRKTFAALGVPQSYRDFVNDRIAKFEAEL